MRNESFREQVEQGLKKLNRQQKVEFAWRCAVRVLPFLGQGGSFDYWDEEKKMTHPYGVPILSSQTL